MKKLVFSSLLLVVSLMLSAQIPQPGHITNQNLNDLSVHDDVTGHDPLENSPIPLPENFLSLQKAQSLQIVLDSIIDFTYSSPADSTPLTRWTYHYNSAGQFETLYTYNWNSSSNEWENSLFIEYTYNDNGDFILVMLYAWDSASEQWVTNSKSEYDYDEMGNLTLLASYFWDQGLSLWIGNFKSESEYDENGNTIQEIQFSWDDEINDWVNDLLYENMYDLNGYLVETGQSDWIEGQWIPDYKVVYEINLNGDPDSSFFYNWNSDEWEVSQKQIFTYNDQNLLVQSLTYHWTVNNVWLFDIKRELEYDDNGNRTLDAYFLWNGFNWDGYQKSEIEYDDNGYVILYIYSVWDNLGMDWEYYSRLEQENTASGNIIWFDYSTWNTDTGEWQYVSREEYTYTLGDFQSSVAVFSWDMESSNWMIESKSFRYYSELSVSIMELMAEIPNVQPNPFSNSTTIKFSLKQSSHVTLTLHNQQGSKVMEVIDQELPPGQHQIVVDGSGLSDGFYFGVLKNSEKTISVKLIKR
jgi:hypothetical protein